MQNKIEEKKISIGNCEATNIVEDGIRRIFVKNEKFILAAAIYETDLSDQLKTADDVRRFKGNKDGFTFEDIASFLAYNDGIELLKSTVFIRDIWVAPEYRGQCIGTNIMKDLMESLPDAKIFVLRGWIRNSEVIDNKPIIPEFATFWKLSNFFMRLGFMDGTPYMGMYGSSTAYIYDRRNYLSSLALMKRFPDLNRNPA